MGSYDTGCYEQKDFQVVNSAKAKGIKGYWSNGRFVKPEEAALEEVGPPSKTMLKAEADEKQALGEALLTLRADLMARLDLPTKLLDAIKDAKKITNFEGRRRQMQFIGKLMRPLDADPIRDAINEHNRFAVLRLPPSSFNNFRSRWGCWGRTVRLIGLPIRPPIRT